MQSSYPPRPPFPPRPGSSPGESDRDLVAQLGGPHAGRHRAVALLLGRHWRATRDYAAVCLGATGPSAHLVSTAAFHDVLGRLAGGAVGGALRPQLLVAVREIVRTWAGDDAACVVMPELRKPAGGRGLRATMPGTPERRQLAERAFRALPAASQCLLWHTEVEAEPINIPAGLSGVDAATATTALEQAREQFRTACVRAHRELAPSQECRFHNRLLDVPMRRGGALLPDVRHHLADCAHCRYAAEQLSRIEGGLDVLLAETVLGWGARRYLDSRPGRGASPKGPDDACLPAPEAARPAATGRHRTLPEGRRHKAMVLGVGLASLALLATVLVTKGWSDGSGVPDPGATWGAPVGGPARPGATGTRSSAGTGGRSGASPSAASAGASIEVAHGRLRSLGSGRCLDVRGGEVTAGAAARLAACSSAASQQWSYGDDGLLRSAADPALCLVADPGTRNVVVSGCVVHAGEVSYDLTVRGELLLRWHQGLALAPDGGRPAVAARDGSPGQRWALEPGAAGPPGNTGGPHGPDAGAREPANAGAESPAAGSGSRSGAGAGAPNGKGGQGDGSSPPEYDLRIAQAGAHHDPDPGPAAPAGAGHTVSAVVSSVRGVVASPVTGAVASVRTAMVPSPN
ncbi:RICIN domain-containing protein [Streptomyces sp. NPDC002520]